MNRLKETIIRIVGVLAVMAVATGLLATLPRTAWAVGTAAGTTISNTATVTYTLGSNPTVLSTSATNTFDVQEVIDLSLVWQDAANVAVNAPHTDRVVTFLLTNIGNGQEDVDLIVDAALSGDQFDPDVQGLWLETNATAGLQSDDTLYTGAGVSLAADAAVTVYILSNIQAGYADGDRGDVQLTAASMTPGAAGQAPGTDLPGAGDGGVDAVVGTTTAQAATTAAYEVSTVQVTLTKSIAAIQDVLGGSQPSTGARVTYRLDVDLTGSGTAAGLVISDPIPADMTYAPGSLTLDGVPMTDALDGDRGDFGATAVDTVTILFNDTVAPAAWRIQFDAIIN